MDQNEEALLRQSIRCHLCEDTGIIVDGWSGIECMCQEAEGYSARLEGASIPTAFKNSRFDNYVISRPFQKALYDTSTSYIQTFPTIHNSCQNSLGFIAEYGEARLKDISKENRANIRHLYNSYGLGKTHLQMAAAHCLINQQIWDTEKKRMRYVSVKCISDVSFMNELVKAKTFNDRGEEFNRLFESVIRCDVLIWDDLGKTKFSEAKLDLYYNIINPRYIERKPIIFSSNEDTETLEDKIGHAAADRLLGMSRDYLVAVKGPSFRTGENDHYKH